MRAPGFEEETGVTGMADMPRPQNLLDADHHAIPNFFLPVCRTPTRPLQVGPSRTRCSCQSSGLEGGKHEDNTL